MGCHTTIPSGEPDWSHTQERCQTIDLMDLDCDSLGNEAHDRDGRLDEKLDNIVSRVANEADAEYQPGRRLLGAYGFVGDPPEQEAGWLAA